MILDKQIISYSKNFDFPIMQCMHASAIGAEVNTKRTKSLAIPSLSLHICVVFLHNEKWIG